MSDPNRRYRRKKIKNYNKNQGLYVRRAISFLLADRNSISFRARTSARTVSLCNTIIIFFLSAAKHCH